LSSTTTPALKVGIISLGCAKNLVDTEIMLGHLDRRGCHYVEDRGDADVIVINTCGFIGPAREESVQTILEVAELKQTGRLKRLVVAGCMVQRYHEQLKQTLPEVDAFIGLDQLEQIIPSVGLEPASADDSKTGAPVGPSRSLYDHLAPRHLATPSWSAYLKIAEGCDHTCSFCAIPSFRGSFRSRSREDLVAEARRLVSGGVRELNLIAQDTSHYGRDRGEMDGLPRLLEALDQIEELRWIRLHYLYPNTITPELIATMARLPKVLPYVDLPLQHADRHVLSRMLRGGTARSHLDLLNQFRTVLPGAVLRSTFIVGFPGESDEEFQNLLQFVEEARFDHLGVFTYSHEEDTTAIDFQDDVPEEVKQKRRAELMELQATIVAERNQKWTGQTVEVLVEGAHPETEHLLVGRMASQAPDVDGQVLINDGCADPGSFVRVELTDVAGYDLVGKIIDEDVNPGKATA
jgi:ribosomal protein S12 methylthiotransferase